MTSKIIFTSGWKSVARTTLLENTFSINSFTFTIALICKTLGTADVIDTSRRSSVVSNHASFIIEAVVRTKRITSLDASSVGTVHGTFRSSSTGVGRVSSTRVVGGRNTTDPFKSNSTNHTSLDVSLIEATIFADVTTNDSIGILISPGTSESDAHDGFFREGSWLHDDVFSIPSSVGAIELSTSIQSITTTPECNAKSAICLTFRTFHPLPSISKALSTNPTISSKFPGEEVVFISRSDCSEVTLDTEVVVVIASLASDEVRLGAVEELVNVSSLGVVQGVCTSSPTDDTNITALRSREEGNLAKSEIVVRNRQGTFESQDTKERIPDNSDTNFSRGDVAFKIVNTLGISLIDGDGDSIKLSDTRARVDCGISEGIVGNFTARSVGDVDVFTSVPFTARILVTFSGGRLIEASWLFGRFRDAATFDEETTKTVTSKTSELISAILFTTRSRSNNTLVGFPHAGWHVDATEWFSGDITVASLTNEAEFSIDES